MMEVRPLPSFDPPRKGPLAGLHIIEAGGIGPVPFCGMLLADMGAEIVRFDRVVPGEMALPVERRFEVMLRGRRSLALDLKQPAALAAARRMLTSADALIEGFRPGVMERLGLGPDVALAANPRLVYGRMTGWGQSGPLAMAAGHDINYLALTGALHAIGPRDKPAIPLNLIADFGGGAMYLAMGVLAALLEARTSGRGQVVDAAMIDGATSLMAMVYGFFASGYWSDERAANRLDSGAPYYNVYETKDGLHIAIGANEPKFYRATLVLLGIAGPDLPDQHDKSAWPAMKDRFAAAFRTRTRDEWTALCAGREDLCFAPVLSLAEAPSHPHQRARGNFVDVAGILQPAPTPRFDRTPGAIQGPPPEPGADTDTVLADWGFAAAEIAALHAAGAIVQQGEGP
jgi:alpha-methylacyl-CoA racemase